MRFVSVEANALSMLALQQLSGQAQVRLPGPFALSVGARRVHVASTEEASYYDETMYGSPGLDGMSYEVALRVYAWFLRLPSRSGMRTDFWVAPTYVRGRFSQTDTLTFGQRGAGIGHEPNRGTGYDGGALDVACQLTWDVGPAKVYTSFGLGAAYHPFNHPPEQGSAPGLEDIFITPLRPRTYERSTFSPRVLATIGVGF